MSRRPEVRRSLRLRALAAVPLGLLAPATAHAAAAATLTPASSAFGDRQVEAAASTPRAFTLRNTGDEALDVGAATLQGTDPGQFTITEDACAGTTLQPGATCLVRVAFAPTATGPKSATLSVPAGALAPRTAALTGTGRDLVAEPALLDLGRVRAGTDSEPGTITLRNRAAEPYTLGAVSVSNSSVFTVVSNTCSSATLAQDETCAVTVRGNAGQPGVPTGSLNVAGFGPAPATVRLEATQPAGGLAPVVGAFGAAAPGDVAGTREFTVRNTASEPLEVTGAAIEGEDAGSFAVVGDGCTAAPVDVGGSCLLRVAFRPGKAGFHAARLAVDTNAEGPGLIARLGGFGFGTGAGTDPLAAPFDLADQPIVRLPGDGGDFHGQGVSSGGCDLNDDGFDDVLTGAPTWSRFPTQLSREGAAYVTFGRAEPGVTDLAAAGPAQNTLRIEGQTPGSNTGAGVSCAGDVNGDGIEDLVVGSWNHDYGQPDRDIDGIAHVVFGARDLGSTSPIDLGLLGDKGFAITVPDDPAFDHFGWSVDGVGDLDGDGRDEVAVMANVGDPPGRTNAGVTLVVRGRATTAVVDASNDHLIRIEGGSPGGPEGTTSTPGQALDVNGVGDVNADGTPDIGIGQYTAVYAGRSTASGAAFVVSGAERGTVDLALASDRLLAVGGPRAQARLGTAIDGAGDVNGDDVQDLLIGADASSTSVDDGAYVVYGSSDLAGEVLDSAALGDRGYRIQAAAGDSTGFGLAPAGDLNRDGLADVAVGSQTAGDAGALSIVFGVADPSTLDAPDGAPEGATRERRLATMTAQQGSRIEGTTTGERFGRQVGAVGDVDGNGAPDLAAGADQAFRFGRTGAGEVSVVLMPGPAPRPPDPPGSGDGGGDNSTGDGAGAGGGAGGGAGLPAPAATRAPSVRTPLAGVRVRRLRAGRPGRVLVGVRCVRSSVPCSVTLALRLAGRRTAVRRVRVVPGTTRKVALRLTAFQRRSLRRNGRLRATLIATARVPGSSPSRRLLRVTVRHG